MPEFKPTEEQQAIIEAAVHSKDNLLISALAGAAKTTTLTLIANTPAMQQTATLCLAFNKKIALEMKERLPSSCVSMTLNSLGHRVWGQAIGRRLSLDKDKTRNLLKEYIDTRPEGQREVLYDNFSFIAKAIREAKQGGWVPENCDKPGARPLISDDEFFMSLDEEPFPEEERAIRAVMLQSITLAYTGLIDFDDQVFMTAVFPCSFPKYPLIMIDESQDLSPINHRALERMFSRRVIAVGDECQAIYGFRGAHSHSMSVLMERFDMTSLYLSTSFRCPRTVVSEAQWRAPHMTAPDWAKEGSVQTLSEWTVDQLPQDAVIICRNNAPLFSQAIRLLIDGRFPEILGNDIGATIIKAMEKLGPGTTPTGEVHTLIDAYEKKKLSRTRPESRAKAKDFCECMRIFASRGETLSASIEYAKHVIYSTGPIKMMTGHKSKGLEFKNVFILDRDLVNIHDMEGQDRNLMYVMQTRSMENLTYITSEGYRPKEMG